MECAHFFNEKQKEIKCNMINSLLDLYLNFIRQHESEFDKQTILDLAINVPMTFYRQCFINIFVNIYRANIDDINKIMDEANKITKEIIIYEVEKERSSIKCQ